MDELRTREVENLISVLAKSDNPDDLYRLFEDLFTIREIKEISQRLEVARMLSAGKPYTTIEKVTGASATTIARVSKCLSYGSGGYAQALELLAAIEGASEK
ncbi:MAG: YerC/YecD family TrpR-related protein [Eggerthellaceae bacterium]|jgi:TrpR-related protein YerC/YecD|nr:YerC/YecD family TrpR-related protein [Eggerthellaceae bacterium]MDR2721436.1 hypothetical protein [Coriobacteriaceae bacterium]